MALWDIDNLDQAASESKAAGNGKKREWIEGAYHVKLLEFKSGMSRGNPQKGIKPYSKWTIQWLFTEGETAAQQPTVGGKKIQHFNVGHPTKDTSDGAKRDLLLVLKLCGVDLDKLNNEGDLFMAAQGLTQEQPTLVYYIKPQATEGFLDWYPKGTVKADGSVIDKDGNALGKWGLVESNTEAPAAVQQETASDSEDIGL
jgi:hypothetical protein